MRRLICLVALAPALALAQQPSFTGTPILYDFTGYTGGGLQATPTAGQLSSNAFSSRVSAAILELILGGRPIR